MQTLELSIADRIILLNILPAQGGLVQMRLIKDLKAKVNFSPEEIHLYQIQDLPDGGCKWNPETAQAIYIDISPEQVTILKQCLKVLDETEAITEFMTPTAIKIDEL